MKDLFDYFINALLFRDHPVIVANAWLIVVAFAWTIICVANLYYNFM